MTLLSINLGFPLTRTLIVESIACDATLKPAVAAKAGLLPLQSGTHNLEYGLFRGLAARVEYARLQMFVFACS